MRSCASRSGSTSSARCCSLGVWSRELCTVGRCDVPEDPIAFVVCGLALPILEAVVGAAVAAGYRTRTALIAGATLMLVLMFGSALRQDWSTVVIQLTYSLIYCVLLAGAQVDRYCLDHVRSVAPEIAL